MGKDDPGPDARAEKKLRNALGLVPVPMVRASRDNVATLLNDEIVNSLGRLISVLNLE